MYLRFLILAYFRKSQKYKCGDRVILTSRLQLLYSKFAKTFVVVVFWVYYSPRSMAYLPHSEC